MAYYQQPYFQQPPGVGYDQQQQQQQQQAYAYQAQPQPQAQAYDPYAQQQQPQQQYQYQQPQPQVVSYDPDQQQQQQQQQVYIPEGHMIQSVETTQLVYDPVSGQYVQQQVRQESSPPSPQYGSAQSATLNAEDAAAFVRNEKEAEGGAAVSDAAMQEMLDKIASKWDVGKSPARPAKVSLGGDSPATGAEEGSASSTAAAAAAEGEKKKDKETAGANKKNMKKKEETEEEKKKRKEEENKLREQRKKEIPTSSSSSSAAAAAAKEDADADEDEEEQEDEPDDDGKRHVFSGIIETAPNVRIRHSTFRAAALIAPARGTGFDQIRSHHRPVPPTADSVAESNADFTAAVDAFKTLSQQVSGGKEIEEIEIAEIRHRETHEDEVARLRDELIREGQNVLRAHERLKQEAKEAEQATQLVAHRQAPIRNPPPPPKGPELNAPLLRGNSSVSMRSPSASHNKKFGRVDSSASNISRGSAGVRGGVGSSRSTTPGRTTPAGVKK